MSVPGFTANNILPPYVGANFGAPASFSPYAISMSDLIGTFGSTWERRAMLVGLLDLRERLRNLGFAIQYQWIDGSFVEKIEVSEGRAPGDIDLATFLRRPSGAKSMAALGALIQSNMDFFDRDKVKATYHCDHMMFDFDAGISIETVCYWHSLFAHKRNGVWKGYLRVLDEGSSVDSTLRQQLVADGVTA